MQDTSYEFPGRRDYVRVKQADGKFDKMTKHVLMLTLREAFELWVGENPSMNVSLTTFYNHRPPNVLLHDKMPQNVCVCIYHENMNMTIQAVHKYCDRFPKDHRDLLKCMTCNEDNIISETCQLGDCQGCNDLCTIERLVQLVDSSPIILKAWFVSYIRWEKGVCNDGKERLMKVEKEGSMYSILENILRYWPYFRFHRLIKVKQDEAFNTLHSRKDPKPMLLQFYFSEMQRLLSRIRCKQPTGGICR